MDRQNHTKINYIMNEVMVRHRLILVTFIYEWRDGQTKSDSSHIHLRMERWTDTYIFQSHAFMDG